MKPAIQRLAAAANSHFVANSGLAACAAAGAVHVGADMLSQQAIHASLAISILVKDLDALTFPLLTTGAIAAYFGRPSTVTASEGASAPAKSAKAAAILDEVRRRNVFAAFSKGSRIVAAAPKDPPPPPPRTGSAPWSAPSTVGADARRSSRRAAAMSLTVAGVAGGRSPMTLVQEFGLIEEIAGDVASFASGQPVAATKSVGNMTYTAKAVILPNGPVAPYQAISGSFMSILGLVFADVAAFSAGAPIAIAEKINKTWYGTELTAAPAASAPVATPGAGPAAG